MARTFKVFSIQQGQNDNFRMLVVEAAFLTDSPVSDFLLPGWTVSEECGEIEVEGSAEDMLSYHFETD